ncbi:MAG TPA: DNA-formamidopyrimidine glycosylase family protein [Actinomycetes bacterium]|nr:DNA-formamidopyrimidine glycosylase family protein [Actinomycetes bacterium]
MPEGHTIHRLARELGTRLAGGPVRACSPQGRFAAGAASIDGHPLARAEAHGKHLLARFDHQRSRLWVHVHLGIYGRLTFGQAPAPAPIGLVRLRLEGPRAWADLRGANTCELLDAAGRDALIARLGPDPLRRDADPDRAWVRMQRSRAPVATLLMDQSVLAGVGNIYRAEILFRHGVDPMLPGRALAREVWDAMWADLQVLMRAGVRTGRIDTVRPEHDPRVTGRAPRRDRHGGEVYVYRRAGQHCHVCATPVASAVLAGRNLFWCPRCQPPGATGAGLAARV